MAKVPFSKLGIKVNDDTVQIPWGEQMIEVRKYLPFVTKAEVISRVINLSITENGYYNPLQIKLYLALEIIYNYTNISFTAKQKEDVFKLYDMIIGSGLFKAVVDAIPSSEWEDIQKTVWDTIANVYEYKNSAVGILEAMKQDYSDVTMDLENLQEIISDPQSFGLLKTLLPMLTNEVDLDQNN